MTELSRLVELLQLEKKADYEYFKTIIQNKPLEIKRKEGFSWYPVVPVKSGYTVGDRAFVEIERTDAVDQPHQFRSGNMVNLFTLQPDAYHPEFSGTINYMDKKSMRVVLNSKDLPDWLSGGQIGVDLLFDERSYIEMERAMKIAINASGNRLADLRDVLLGIKKDRITEKQTSNGLDTQTIFSETPAFSALNDSQKAAVRRILAGPDVAIIHGPPGTGKTTTLVQAVYQLCQVENTVLVTAPSNTAADVLTERLAAQGLRVVRIGNISRIEAGILSLTLDAQVAAHPESKHIKKIKIEAAALRQKARAFKRKFDFAARNERDRLKDDAREMSNWANQLEERLIEEILTSADVITCTLVGAAHPTLHSYHFTTVVIDEAAQALEPASWIPILKASKVVLAGDPLQLPPTIRSEEARKGGFDVTLLEKCIHRLSGVSLLNVQYRMNRTIMGFSNDWFYKGALQAAPEVADRATPVFQDEQPLVFIDTVGCNFEEYIHPENFSRFNPDEYYTLRSHLHQFIELFEFDKPSIGFISPYREQIIFIQQEIAEDVLLMGAPVSVHTIDGFQGQERDVIYISLVRSNEKAEIGFLKDYHRMNVAMTRARMKLIIIGDSATIGQDKFYKAMLDYCEKHGTYRTAWEFMK